MAVIKSLEMNFQEDKPSRKLLYEDINAKVIRFYLKKGQEIKPHKSPSSVFICVLKGKGLFSLPDGEETLLEEGSSVFYAPMELHGFKALEDLVVQAVIAPNPTAGKLKLA